MSDILQKCAVCAALIDEEDMFCANCGTEAPDSEQRNQHPHAATSTHNFTCNGCGASMSYDASAQALRCPFCGSLELTNQQDTKVLAPNRIVTFSIDRQQAEGIMRKWLGQGFWRPSDLATTAAIAKMTPVYVPYWVFQAKTYTNWTADSSDVPFGYRGDWRPLYGQRHGQYAGLLVGASGVLTPSETENLCPFDLAASRPAGEVSLENWIVEQFRVQRKYARPQARHGLEALESESCLQFVPGRCRNMKVNVRLEGLASEPMLLPVWIMAYKYKGQLFRFLINGQTGKAHGQAPFSYKKLFLVVGIVGAVVLLLFLLVVGLAAMGG